MKVVVLVDVVAVVAVTGKQAQSTFRTHHHDPKVQEKRRQHVTIHKRTRFVDKMATNRHNQPSKHTITIRRHKRNVDST